MEQIKTLLQQQKEQIEKDLAAIATDQWNLKVQKYKLSKMLKQVNKQIETVTES